MGFRFRKSISLGKGVRLNVGKSSGSLSFGGKGFRQSISSTGRATTSFGIPGTGLYYTKTKNVGSLVKGLLGRDPKRPVFKTAVGVLSPEEEVAQFQEDIAVITSLHREEDYPRDIQWEEVLASAPPFGPSEEGPTQKAVKEELRSRRPGLLQRVFQGGALKKQEEALLAEAREEDESLLLSYENSRKVARKVMEGDKEGFLEVLETLKVSQHLTDYIKDARFSYHDADTLVAEITLSIEQFIPDAYKTLTPTGRLSVKQYTKTDYYAIASQFTAGVVLRMARNLLNLLPLEDVLLHVTELEVNPQTGIRDEKLILSVLVDRKTLDKIDLSRVNAFDVLTQFHHEVRFVKTRGFSAIEPLRP